MVNRIAYIDNSGDLLVINPDGTGQERLTGDALAGAAAQALYRGESYGWPAWSSDGSRIAVSRVSLTEGTGGLSVQMLELSTGRMVSAYDNEIPAPVADGVAHYAYWSPDDRYLTFLAPTSEGLSLLVKDFQSGGEITSAASGAPLYYHWSGDSQWIAITQRRPGVSPGPGDRRRDHGGGRRLQLSRSGHIARRVLLAFGGIIGGVQGICVSPMGEFPAPHLFMETQGMTAFAWSPDGATLAVSEQSRPGAPVFGSLRLVSADGSGSSLMSDEALLAFFWSPGGDRIAWIGIDPLSRSMDLVMSAVESGRPAGEPRHLFRFSPTGEMFTWFSFFDQYACSHSIWSLDGSAIALTGVEGPEPGRRNGSGPSGGQVFVVDVDTGDGASHCVGQDGGLVMELKMRTNNFPLMSIGALLAGGVMLLLLSLAACSEEPTPTPTPEPVDPHKELSRTVARLLELRSVSFDLDHVAGSTRILPGILMHRAYGDAAVPDEFGVTVEAELIFPRSYLEIKMTVVDGAAYMTNVLTGEWGKVSLSTLPINLSNFGDIIARIIQKVQDPELAGEENVDGVEVYFISGVILSEDLKELVPSAGTGFPVRLDVVTERATGSLRQALITGRVVESDPPDSQRRLRLNNQNKPVNITAPEL